MHRNSSAIRILYPNNNDAQQAASEQYVIQRFEFCTPISKKGEVLVFFSRLI